MQTIRYEAPTTVADAVRAIGATPGAMILAGGTDLLVQYHAGIRRPSVFVDVKRIPELMRISVDEGGATIGAAVPAADICAHPDDPAALARAGRSRAPDRLDADSGSQQPRRQPVQRVAGGRLDLRADRERGQSRDRRSGRASARCRSSSSASRRAGRCSSAGELLVSVRLPRPAPLTADAYLRFIPRTEMDIAVAGAGVSVTLDANGIVHGRARGASVPLRRRRCSCRQRRTR